MEAGLSDLALQLFSTARERYQSAVWWQAVVIAGLLGFHLTVMTPYVELSAEQSGLDRQLREQKRLAGLMTEMGDGVARLKDVADAHALAARTVQELRDAFADLSAAVAAIKEPERQAASGAIVPPPNMPFPAQVPLSNMPAMNMQMPRPMMQQMQMPRPMQEQMQQVQMPQRQTVFDATVIDADLRRRIAEAQSQGELQVLIRPVVETAIVTPIFDRFRSEWRSGPLVEMKATVGTLIEKAEQAAGIDASAGEAAARLREAAAALLTNAEQLELKPGNDPYWWETVQGKGATMDANLAGMAGRVDRLLSADREISNLSRQVAALLSQKQALLEAASARLKEIEAEFKEQQGKVASFAKPLQAISLDLAVIAPLYPLLLGLAIAGLLAWPASRLLELRDAAGLIQDTEAGRIARAWLAARAGGPGGRIDLMLIPVVLFALAWITFATVQLSGFPGIVRDRLVLLACVGGLAVVTALVYRRNACRRALAIAAPG